MGVYIKGIKMPTSCMSCGFKINCDECEGYECFCTVLRRDIGYMPYNRCFLREDAPVVPSDCRLDDCPLVQVPDHGRLIDADALCEFCNNVIDHSATPNDIMRFPAVIPASEEGET